VFKFKNFVNTRHCSISQKISTCRLTHDVSSLEDDNIKYTCIFRTDKIYAYEIEVSINILFKNFVNTRHCSISTIYQGFVELYTMQILGQLKPFYIFLEFPFWCLWRVACSTSIHLSIALRST
jgi:hypothetical protein